MGLLKIYSPDLGFHLRSAQWIVVNKRFIYTDSFTYPSSGNNYYDLQWLYQLLIFTLYKTGNAKLVVISNALLITRSFVFIWMRLFRNESSEFTKAAVVFSLIAILVVQPLTFEIRPHVLSWIFLNLTLFTLNLIKEGNKIYYFYNPS